MDLSDVLFIIGIIAILGRFSDQSVEIKRLASRVIVTSKGRYRGVLVEIPKYTGLPDIEGYLGVQYAFTSTDRVSARFQKSQTLLGNWIHIKDVSNYQAVCPQVVRDTGDITGHLPSKLVASMFKANLAKRQIEECLTINLYVPMQEWTDSTSLPVMVFVHGESYEIGTGNAYDGSVLASYGDVIVITVNYRLGVLGFLNLNDSHASGNQALQDLLAVLHWVKENIAAFHGDPDRVTVFGHGHGAALVNILLLSPLVAEENLIHRAILQSGSALSSWATSYDPFSCAYRLAQSVNCLKFPNDTASVLKCLKSKSAEELVNNSPPAPKYYSCMAPAPNGQKIFPYPVTLLLQDPGTAFRSIPVMMGVTRNEAYSYLRQEELENGISVNRKNQILRTFVANNFRFHRQEIFEILEHEYSSWDTTQSNLTRRDNILQLLSDALYVAPLIKMAEEHSVHKNTFLYAFGHTTNAEKYHNWSSAVHGDDLPYVFGAPLVDGLGYFPKKYTPEEKRLSASMMRYWTNFAKTGDPNFPVNVTRFETEIYKDPEWAPYDIRQKKFMYFDGKSVLKHHYRGKQLSLWFDLIPKLGRVDSMVDRENPDPDEHDLVDAKNISTYDEFHRLISNFKRLFPTQPPVPPPQMIEDGLGSSGIMDGIKKPPKRPAVTENLTTKNDRSKNKRDESPITSAPVTIVKHTDETVSSVPLSITVAVGCSLLFLNVILFTAVYYQRRRIQRLNRRNSRNASDTNNEGANNPPSSGKEPGEDTELKETGLHHTTCAAQLEDSEKPNIQSNPLYSVICKSSSADSSHRCSYESVSTDSSSPSRSTSKRNLPNNITPSLHKDTKRGSSPKPSAGKIDGPTSNHIVVKQSNTNKDTVTVV